MYNILQELVHVIDTTFSQEATPPECPPPASTTSPLRDFQSSAFQADMKQIKTTKKVVDSCRRQSILRSPNPRSWHLHCVLPPWGVLWIRARSWHAVFVYDNACKLHQYCLHREPRLFQNTLFLGACFLVDRFHWRGHNGCSSGYNLHLYGEPNLKSLNSQVNEQTNADLQKIRGQLAYMTPLKFHFHLSLSYQQRTI